MFEEYGKMNELEKSYIKIFFFNKPVITYYSYFNRLTVWNNKNSLRYLELCPGILWIVESGNLLI